MLGEADAREVEQAGLDNGRPEVGGVPFLRGRIEGVGGVGEEVEAVVFGQYACRSRMGGQKITIVQRPKTPTQSRRASSSRIPYQGARNCWRGVLCAALPETPLPVILTQISFIQPNNNIEKITIHTFRNPARYSTNSSCTSGISGTAIFFICFQSSFVNNRCVAASSRSTTQLYSFHFVEFGSSIVLAARQTTSSTRRPTEETEFPGIDEGPVCVAIYEPVQGGDDGGPAVGDGEEVVGFGIYVEVDVRWWRAGAERTFDCGAEGRWSMVVGGGAGPFGWTLRGSGRRQQWLFGVVVLCDGAWFWRNLVCLCDVPQEQAGAD